MVPVVSVGIPVYNGEKHLAETLDCLLAQTLTDFEIIISDNASTDRTPEIGRAYKEKDPRVRYFRNEQNIGLAMNFNRVFELANAPLFHGGACDDIYAPPYLERCVDSLARDPGLVLSYTRTRMIDGKGQPLLFDRDRNCYLNRDGDFLMTPVRPHVGTSDRPELRFREVLWHMGWAVPLSGTIRRDALRRTSLYRNYYGADKVLLAELSLLGRFHQVSEELFAKRIHEGDTYHKTTRERAEYQCKEPSGVPQFKMLRDYARMTLTRDMGARQRLHCMITVAGMGWRREAWRRLLVPGPDNYFGISFADR